MSVDYKINELEFYAIFKIQRNNVVNTANLSIVLTCIEDGVGSSSVEFQKARQTSHTWKKAKQHVYKKIYKLKLLQKKNTTIWNKNLAFTVLTHLYLWYCMKQFPLHRPTPQSRHQVEILVPL